MEQLTHYSDIFAQTIWSLPLVFALFTAGLIFSIYFIFPQIKYFKHAIEITMGKFDDKENPGEITHFQALCAALSATIGLGNIAGVAVAISAGGPGAIFWMWVAGFLGMATKFTSISLSLFHRQVTDKGVVHGGPMYTIQNGMGKKYTLLAFIFSIFTLGGAFGAGNLFQANQMASILDATFSIPKSVTGIAFAILTGIVLIGGIKRIGNIASKLVPGMVVIYFIGAIGILLVHYQQLPSLFFQIFHDAFHGSAAIGGFAGIAFKEVVIQGVRRAVFSNEAGLGSAAMAHSAAKSSPIQEGLVGMLGPFIDTIVVCTLTAMVLLVTGVWTNTNGIQGSELTALAFSTVYGAGGNYLMALAIVLFAFSSIISWSYYGEQGIVFMFGEKSIKYYRYIFTSAVFIGAILKLDIVLNISDGFLGLMLIPNIIANIYLSKSVKKGLKEYHQSFE